MPSAGKWNFAPFPLPPPNLPIPRIPAGFPVESASVQSAAPSLFASSVLLVLANLIPLAGALFYGWSVFEIVLVYWAENLIVGVYTLFRMLLAGGNRDPVSLVGKLFSSGFFAVHYGIFCLVHGFFVFSLLGGSGPSGAEAFDRGMIPALIALVASHGFSFVKNYLIGGEFRDATVQTQMFSPYPRMVVLHVAILFGAFAIQALGSPLAMLLILIAGKTVLDVFLHRWSHRKTARS